MNTPIAIERFNSLDLSKKATLICGYGIHIHTIIAGGYTISVYEINGAIIDTFFNNSTKRIDFIDMPNYDKMDMHAQSIDLNKLF